MNTLTPSSGEAESTVFYFDVSEFQTINAHINSELGISSSAQSISFTYAKLTHPDLSTVYVTDTASFTVPSYKVHGATSFEVKVELFYTVNG